ncbi:hypothetical protein K456DRAFT_1824993, partial [Colletotrichum gloeosporioides 23]
HFNQHIKPHINSSYHLFIINKHKSHYAANFKIYYKENNIITLYIPAYSSHLLQPLDIRCFKLLKKAYTNSRELRKLILDKEGIMHITKDDFFPAFKAAFFSSIGEGNV